MTEQEQQLDYITTSIKEMSLKQLETEITLKQLTSIVSDNKEIKSDIKEINSNVADIDKRVTLLESKVDQDRWKWAGLGGVVILAAKELLAWGFREYSHNAANLATDMFLAML